MNFKEFIGIDVSKAHIDVFIYHKKLHRRFGNNQSGFEQLMDWLWKQVECRKEEVLFGFEHTGIYSLALSLYLDESSHAFSILSGLELKRSLGLRRGKSDQVDAEGIACYLYEKRERISPYKMPNTRQLTLKRLLSYRERLVKERAAFKGRFKEYTALLSENEHQVLFDSHLKMIDCLNEEIKKVERELYRLVKEDDELCRQFELITSIKGVGPQTALLMIVLTNGFDAFATWRKFASYAGTAPFPYESGKLIRKKKVSHLANKRIKTLLSCCAVSAIQYNPEMKLYYQRRINENKNHMSSINVVRNKILARIFAVVRRGTPYAETYKFAS